MQLSLSDRLVWIFRFVMFGILAAVLISPELYMTDRNFPLIPLTVYFIPLPYPLDYIVYSGMIVIALLLIIYADNRPLLIALVSIFGFLMLADQMRWQGFNIFYFFLSAAFLFSAKHPERLLSIIRITIIGYFFWTGIQNINNIYFENIFPWIFEPYTKKFLPEQAIAYFNYLGYLLPFIQIFAGIGLLFDSTRNTAMWTGITLIGIIFVSMSPIGHNWNKIQLPYYLTIMSVTYLAFNDTEFELKSLFNYNKSIIHIAAILMFLVLPIFNFVGLYDNSLSFKDFSGKGLYCKIYIDDEISENLPEVLKQYTFKTYDNKKYFDVFYWSMFALKVAPYSEKRVFNQLENYFCSFKTSEDCPTNVVIYTYDDPK